MTSLFSKEAVADGNFTKAISLVTISILMIIGGGLYVYCTINNLSVPPVISTIIGAGLGYFIKASGLAEGAALSRGIIDAVLPQTTVAQALAENTAATKANTAATQQPAPPVV